MLYFCYNYIKSNRTKYFLAEYNKKLKKLLKRYIFPKYKYNVERNIISTTTH